MVAIFCASCLGLENTTHIISVVPFLLRVHFLGNAQIDSKTHQTIIETALDLAVLVIVFSFVVGRSFLPPSAGLQEREDIDIATV